MTNQTDRLGHTFYGRPAVEVARDLLGKRLVRQVNGQRLSGTIVETEAYCDGDTPDLACHGSKNQGRPTPRTAVMFGPPGRAYVYFTYGMHWLFNVVTGQEGQANAVLVRALEPLEGESVMAHHRPGRKRLHWTNGPGKITRAFDVDGSMNGVDLLTHTALWIEPGIEVADLVVRSGPRVGLGKTPEPWLSIPWRFWVADNPFVSRYR